MLQIFSDKTDFSRAAADLFLQKAEAAVAQRGRFLVALSGGSTPVPLFKLLRRHPYLAQMPWGYTHVFWGDERLVPPHDPGSNYGQAQEILLRHVPVPDSQIYRARVELAPGDAVNDYAKRLATLAENGRSWPRFDLVLLGLGSDGHTASLFPGPLPPAANRQPVMAVTAEYEDRPSHRLTFTPPLINDARHVLFLVSGAQKAVALTAVREGLPDPEKWPAQRIRPASGEVTWYVDQAAGIMLPEAEPQITYKADLEGVDWEEMKRVLVADRFDNGRSPAQLQASFTNSYATCIAYAGSRLVGTARALSDGVCNAYVVDVWTLSSFRQRGIARQMMNLLMAKLPGQHVYLFTDDAVDFYKKLGFRRQGIGLAKVVGEWLQNEG